MKLLINLCVLLIFLIYSCTSTKIGGVYLCEKNLDKEILSKDSLIDDSNVASCLFEKLEFVGESTVIITTQGVEIPASYVIDKNYLRITVNKSDWLLKIEDSKVLTGESKLKGKFRKISKK